CEPADVDKIFPVVAAPTAALAAGAAGVLPLFLGRKPGATSPGKREGQPAAERARLEPGDALDRMVRQLLGAHTGPGARLVTWIEGGVLGVGHGSGAAAERRRDRHLVSRPFPVLAFPLRAPHPEPPGGDLPPERHPAIQRSVDPAEKILVGSRHVAEEPGADLGRLPSDLRRPAGDLLDDQVEEIEVVA